MRASRGVAIGAGSLAVLLGALDTYVVVTIMRDIMDSVEIPVNKIQQVTPIVTCYLLGYIAAMPLLGRASDRFGRKLLLQSSLAAFAVGSVVTAMSDDLTMLVVGRTIQGVASGALLPVTLALGADLWAARNRATVLGGISAAQELGSVLGPLYGIFIVWLLRDWRDVFWINVPLTVIAMGLIQVSLPSHNADGPRQKVDVTGGVLLAIALGLVTVGLYNPEPNSQQALPDWGLPVLGFAAVAAIAFGVWERFLARTRLIDPTGVRFAPFLAALGASLCAGAALMVTLVNVELFGQGVLSMDQNAAAGLLLRFLIALPIGALAGGWIATRVGDRTVSFAGLVIAAGGYWLISKWPVDLLAYRHDFGVFTLPALDTDLAIAGLGLGLVIGPLTSAALRVVPSAQHGIASAGVVVARMTGMLVGMATLSAWGLHRFNQILESLPGPGPDASLLERVSALQDNAQKAFALQYGEMFGITAIVCLVGAALGLLVGGRTVHAETDIDDTLAAGHDAGFVFDEVRSKSMKRTERAPSRLEAPEVGDVFGRYRLRGLLGAGGMGQVFHAYDTELDRQVAIKVLPPQVRADPGFEERFRREARTAAGLDEPHVIPIYDSGEIDGRLFIAMRLISGSDVATLISDGGPMSPELAVSVTEQAALALDAAHAAGLAHRDVKPANLLLAANDFVYLIDFGIARASGETRLTNTGSTIGTLAYMAPERFTTGIADHRSDIYSLACVLHECLTGRTPYPATSAEQQMFAHVNGPPPSPSQIRPEIPTAFDAVIACGMAADPHARYQSAGDLAEAARAALNADTPVIDSLTATLGVHNASPDPCTPDQ